MACTCNQNNVAGVTNTTCPNVAGAQFAACCGQNGNGNVAGVSDLLGRCNLSTQDILLVLGIVILLICLFCNC